MLIYRQKNQFFVEYPLITNLLYDIIYLYFSILVICFDAKATLTLKMVIVKSHNNISHNIFMLRIKNF